MPAGDRVPFQQSRGLVVMRVTLNHQVNATLIADSGAAQMVISRSIVSQLGVDIARPLRMQSLVGVGQSPPVPVVRLDQVQVGTSAAAGLEASVFDLPAWLGADGLLGLNFLRHFRVTFEFDTRTLVLRPPPNRRAP